MYITIANRLINSSDIRGITINDKRVLVDTSEEFIRIPYSSEDEIQEAIEWLQLQSISKKDIDRSVKVLMKVCSTYINTKVQCNSCPLNRQYGCMLTQIPINWR